MSQGQPQYPGFFVFDVPDLKIEEIGGLVLPPQTIIPAGQDFKVYGTFTFTDWVAHFFHELMAAAGPAPDWEAKYFAEELGGTNDILLGTVSGDLTATGFFPIVNHSYTTPDTDLVISGGIAQPGTYRLTCTVTCLGGGVTPLPVTGFHEGPMIQIHS